MNTERPEPEYNLGMYVAYKCRRRGDDKERDYKMLITWHPVFIEGQDNPEPCWHYIGDLFEMSGDEVCAKANLVPEQAVSQFKYRRFSNCNTGSLVAILPK